MATLATRKLSEQFEEFLKTVTDKSGEYVYRSRISLLAGSGGKSLVVDYEDLLRYDDELAKRLLEEPDKTLESFRTAAFETLRSESPGYADHIARLLAVRIKGIQDRVPLRKVDTSHIEKMIAVSGMIVRTSELRPLMTEAAFVCEKGDLTYQKQQDDMLMKKPLMCETCDSRNLELDKKRSKFIDYQILRIQELPEELPPGQLPQFFDVNAEGDIVNSARPGDRVVLTGVMRAVPDYSPGQLRMRLFRSQIDCNHIEVIGKEPEHVQITKEDEAVIRSVATRPDAYQKLIASIAPAITGHEPEREAILLLLAGGVATHLPDGTKLRGDINVLFVGDPGTAKSEMLKFAAQVAPRGLFASGRGSTAAGLSAAVIREKNVFMLEAGVVVLADQGIACIDEFDKMRPEDRSALHEQMEQQSYHPSTEILLTDGRKVEIGKFVDDLFASSDGRILGKDCEILPVVDYSVYTMKSTTSVTTTEIARVSRHKAPENFAVIHYSNGRKIIVTPEHPLFVFRRGQLATIPASQVTEGDFVPAPRVLPSSSQEVTLRRVQLSGRKNVTQAEAVSSSLGRILGYLVSEGNFYEGSSAEVDFTNLNPVILQDMQSLMEKTFGVAPTLRFVDGLPAGLRYVSTTLLSWFRANFPELTTKARTKRVPMKVFGSSLAIVGQFLSCAFLGDGSVESEAVCFRTSSRGLAEDYQDLLAKVGIDSRINADRSNDSYKTYVAGHALPRFFTEIVDEIDPRRELIERLVRRGERRNRNHDILPSDIGRVIIGLHDDLGIAYSGRFWSNLRGNTGITRKTVVRELSKLESKLEFLNDVLEGSEIPIRTLRKMAGWSQSQVARFCALPRQSVNYFEREGYAFAQRAKLHATLWAGLGQHLSEASKKIVELKELLGIRFLRVRAVELVPNSGSLATEWVYDMTVEPTHNFVSAGVVLHNSVTIAKGGIYATLNARTAILAAANPLLGKYNPFQNLTENIALPIPLLTRFDIIFIIKDTPTPAEDERLASHILAVHRKHGYNVPPPIEFSLLKKYIAYAKKITPTLTKESEERIKDFYLDLRRRGSADQIGATPRTLESLIRLATARARILLRDQVTEEDALSAIALMNKMVEDVLTDQETKTRADFGVLLGRPAGERGKLATAIEVLKRLEGTDKKPVERRVFKEELLKTTKFADDEDAEKVIKSMFKEGLIYESKPGFFRRVGS